VYHNLIRIIAVNPLHRRQGYAKAMVDYMKSIYPVLSCGSHPSNQQAWAFWSSQDFRIDISNFQKDQFLKQSLESDQIYRGRLLTQTWRISSACNRRKYHNLLLSYAICATLGILAFALAWKMINTKVSRD
jgi:GNAT superfamily N-acetyltransferase